jgi:ribonucleoside-diphosphate reductase beta chain
MATPRRATPARRKGARTLERKRLFNEQGARDWQERRLINGSTTNMLEFNNVKYGWAERLYMKMRSFFWVPEEVPLNDDKLGYSGLTAAEQRAYTRILSFLIFLDSIQTANLGYVANYVTAPEVDVCLKAQAFFETVHSQAYDYVLTSVVDAVTRDSVYNAWREDGHLLRRNRFVTDLYERFVAEPSADNFVRVLMADLVLEGVYFYSGFAFFYALGRQDQMGGTVSIIRLINRDENLHLALFIQMLRTLREEEPQLFGPAMDGELVSMVKDGVEHEAAWGRYVLDGGVAGLDPDDLETYLRYLGNVRCRAVGLPAPYPEVAMHAMQWLDDLASMNEVKTDFFERRVGNYQKAGAKLNFDRIRRP